MKSNKRKGNNAALPISIAEPLHYFPNSFIKHSAEPRVDIVSDVDLAQNKFSFIEEKVKVKFEETVWEFLDSDGRCEFLTIIKNPNSEYQEKGYAKVVIFGDTAFLIQTHYRQIIKDTDEKNKIPVVFNTEKDLEILCINDQNGKQELIDAKQYTWISLLFYDEYILSPYGIPYRISPRDFKGKLTPSDPTVKNLYKMTAAKLVISLSELARDKGALGSSILYFTSIKRFCNLKKTISHNKLQEFNCIYSKLEISDIVRLVLHMFHSTAIAMYNEKRFSRDTLEKTYDIFDSLSFNSFKGLTVNLNDLCLKISYEEYFKLKIHSEYGIVVFVICYIEDRMKMEAFTSEMFGTVSTYENIDTIFIMNLNPFLCNETFLTFVSPPSVLK